MRKGLRHESQTALAAIILAGARHSAGAQNNAADIQKAAEEKAVNLCSTCHGPRGISTSPEFPDPGRAAQGLPGGADRRIPETNTRRERRPRFYVGNRKPTRREDHRWDCRLLCRSTARARPQMTRPSLRKARNCSTRVCRTGASPRAQRATARAVKGWGFPAPRRPARKVHCQTAHIYPSVNACGASDAWHRQGSGPQRNSGSRSLCAVQVAATRPDDRSLKSTNHCPRWN